MPDSAVLLGRALVPGDGVRFVSPASSPSRAWLEESIAVVSGWGLVPDTGRHVLDSWGFMAGSDNDRLADLNDALRDPAIRAVITTVGGAGFYRIADRIDFAAVRNDPKPLVGFSDITNLHLALWSNTRLATIHGCVAGARMRDRLRRLLMTTEPQAISRNPQALTATVQVDGSANGPLLGGNLRELAGRVGGNSADPATLLRGSIVLIEDTRHAGIGQVDRNLTQLIRNGALHDVAGIALGSFQAFDGYDDRGWGVLDVLNDHLSNLGVPVLGGFDIGHDIVGTNGQPDQFPVTLGATAHLDTNTRTLTVSTCVR